MPCAERNSSPRARFLPYIGLLQDEAKNGIVNFFNSHIIAKRLAENRM